MSIENELTEWRNRKRSLHAITENFTQAFYEAGLFRSCLNCDHWSGETNEICNKFKARPPAKIIVLGCSEHSDEIPF